MGPWPLFYYHTSFSSGTKSGISFMEVGPETYKVLNKMWIHGIRILRNIGMMEGHCKSKIAPLYQRGAIIKYLSVFSWTRSKTAFSVYSNWKPTSGKCSCKGDWKLMSVMQIMILIIKLCENLLYLLHPVSAFWSSL